jgi:hypothetical protein
MELFETIPSYFRVNISLFIILGGFLSAAGISYFLYRSTVPPLIKTWRIVLAVIRGLAVALILLLLFSPEITLVWQQRVTDRVALVLDHSASMNLVEKGESRLKRVQKISGDLLQSIPVRTRVSLYGFNTDTFKIHENSADSAQFVTDIDAALTRIVDKEKNLTAMVLISDGNFTSGKNPLYSATLIRTRVHTVGIGDTLDIPDVYIAGVQANKIIYQDQNAPVQIDLLARGFQGKEAVVQIRQRGRVYAAQKVKLGADGSILPVVLNITPQQVGLQRFEVSVDRLPGEVLQDNNKRVVSLEVLKSKIRVGILAAQPDFDFKFLHFILEANPDLLVKKVIPDLPVRGTTSTLGNVLDSADVLILQDFPSVSTGAEKIQALEKLLTAKKIPTWIWWGGNAQKVNRDFFSRFYSLRILNFLNPAMKTQVLPAESAKALPLFNMFSDEQENLGFWRQCPPIEYPFEKVNGEGSLRTVLETIAVSGKEKVRLPVLFLQQTPGQKNMYLLGSGFWRWHFMLAEDNLYHEGWKKIVYNLIRWLSTPGSGNNVILTTDKRIYQVGETVQVSSEVYDGAFNPVDDGMVRITVTGPSGSFDLDGGWVSRGTYTTRFQILNEGEFTLQAQAFRNDVVLGQNSIGVIGTPVDVEFLSTRQDDRLLQNIAGKSGGKYFAEKHYMHLVPELTFPLRHEEVTRTFEVWQKAAVLLLIITLFSLEWLIRKRLGLV